MWSSEYPHVLQELLLHRKETRVWCTVSGRCVVDGNLRYRHFITDFMHQFSRIGRSSIQEITCFLCYMKVHCHVYKALPQLPMLSQIHPIHTVPPGFCKIHSNIILTSTPSSVWWRIPWPSQFHWLTRMNVQFKRNDILPDILLVVVLFSGNRPPPPFSAGFSSDFCKRIMSRNFGHTLEELIPSIESDVKVNFSNAT
jgi:hypothetical protein